MCFIIILYGCLVFLRLFFLFFWNCLRTYKFELLFPNELPNFQRKLKTTLSLGNILCTTYTLFDLTIFGEESLNDYLVLPKQNSLTKLFPNPKNRANEDSLYNVLLPIHSLTISISSWDPELPKSNTVLLYYKVKRETFDFVKVEKMKAICFCFVQKILPPFFYEWIGPYPKPSVKVRG